MTVKEYAELMGISQQAVSYRIKNDRPLPGIKTFSFDTGLMKYVLCPEKKPDWEKYATLLRKK